MVILFISGKVLGVLVNCIGLWLFCFLLYMVQFLISSKFVWGLWFLYLVRGVSLQ
jgi:hypothetical protein